MYKPTESLVAGDKVTHNNHTFGTVLRKQGNYFEVELEDGTKIWITRTGREYHGTRRFDYCEDVEEAKRINAQMALLMERRKLARIEAERMRQERIDAFRKANPNLKYEPIFTPTENPADTFYKAEFVNANGHKGFIFFQIVEGEEVKGFKLEQTVGVDFEYDRFQRSMPSGGSRVFNTVEEAIENLIIDHYWD